MNEATREEISRTEIIKYVDCLVKKHRFTYDKRLLPLLYEFFLRSTEKFHWDKETFFTKYTNFSNNTKAIKIKEFNDTRVGSVNLERKTMYISKEYEQEGKFEELINTFNHEALHQTDLCIRNGKIIKRGLYKIEAEKYTFAKDTMLDEFANEIATYIISSSKLNETMPYMFYSDGYQVLSAAFSIMCSSFDMLEIEAGCLKDKGREEFDGYLKNKYPYVDIDRVLESFEYGFNIIYNTWKDKNKKRIIINDSIVDTACHVMYRRIRNAFIQDCDNEEFIERMTFDIYKMKFIVISIKNEESKIIQQLTELFDIYKKFIHNKDRYTAEERETILQSMLKNEMEVEIIESKIPANYEEKKYNLQEIVNKYYSLSNEQLNDNTQLIEQLQKNFARPTIRQRLGYLLRKNTLSLSTQKEEDDNSNIRKMVKVENLGNVEVKQNEIDMQEVEIEGEK